MPQPHRAPPDVSLTLRERLLLPVLVGCIVFPAWNVGGISQWSEWVNLGLGTAGLLLLILPLPGGKKERHWHLNPMRNLGRLLRFPIFWLGLGFLFYVMLSLSNHWAVFHSDGLRWWLVSVESTGWLPSSVKAPYGAHNGLRTLVQWSGPFLIVCVFWVALVRRRMTSWLLALAVGNAAVFAVLAFVQQANHPQWILGFLPVGPNLNPFGTFVNANAAGMFLYLHLAVALGLTLALARDVSRGWRSLVGLVLTIAAAAIITAGLVGTVSRAALLFGGLLLVGFALSALWRLRQAGPSERLRLGLLLGGATLAGAAAVTFFFSRDTSQLETEAASLVSALKDPGGEARFEVIKVSASMATERPVLGWGPNGFRYAFPEYQRNADSLWIDGETSRARSFFDYAHTDWLQIPIEFGLVGILPLLLMLSWWGWQVLRFRFNAGPIEAGLLLAALLALGHASFDFVFYNPPVLVLFGLWLCLAVRRLQLNERRSRRPAR
ncbi:MAG: O-antigen ligase family protein [Opitutales bacterium]